MFGRGPETGFNPEANIDQSQIIAAFAESLERIQEKTKNMQAQGLSFEEINLQLAGEREKFVELNAALDAVEV